jgi:hypothetical protein
VPHAKWTVRLRERASLLLNGAVCVKFSKIDYGPGRAIRSEPPSLATPGLIASISVSRWPARKDAVVLEVACSEGYSE